MSSNDINILLADDDIDDCFFFSKALKEIPIATKLLTVHDGEQLLDYLFAHVSNLPDLIFLDLSMPRKTGFECLTEIKQNEQLKYLPVIMFSTSFSRDIVYEQSMINLLTNIGANDFIRKPNDFEKLKKIIHKVLIKVVEINR